MYHEAHLISKSTGLEWQSRVVQPSLSPSAGLLLYYSSCQLRKIKRPSEFEIKLSGSLLFLVNAGRKQHTICAAAGERPALAGKSQPGAAVLAQVRTIQFLCCSSQSFPHHLLPSSLSNGCVSELLSQGCNSGVLTRVGASLFAFEIPLVSCEVHWEGGALEVVWGLEPSLCVFSLTALRMVS